MATNYAVVRDGIIENIVVLDDPNVWAPPEGASAYPLDEGERVDIGWAWVDGAPVDPNPPPPDPTP